MGVRKKDETPRRRGEFKAGEEAALLKALKAFDDGGMMLGRFYCATGAGPRRREMLELRSKTGIIDTPGRGLGISLRFLGETTKSGKPRDVPVATNELLQFVVSRRHLEFPFGQLDGTRLDSFREDWEAVLLAAGLEAGEWRGRTWVRTKDADLHWHDLRHVFATRLLVRGIRGGIRRIQKLLGHADIQTTMTYLNVDEDDDADAMVEVNMPQKTRKKRTLKAVA